MLDVRDVTIAFDGPPVLDGVDLTLADGEVVALLGPSGSGKSTLLRVIAGLVAPDRGTVHLDGVDITHRPTHRRGIGMVFQDDQLFPHLNVAANVGFGLRRRADLDGVARRTRVGDLLDLVGLPGFGPRQVVALSGGEAKRVALARSLAPSPRVLLLDEPLTGLDRELHDRLAVELGEILRTTATTALLVTHDRDEATAIADRVVTLGHLSTTLAGMDVVEITTGETHPLRRAVLRDDSSDPAAVVLPGDDDPGTRHLGVRDGDGTLVAVSTWLPRPAPDGAAPAVQLRAMAVDPAMQGSGVGALLLAAGVERAFAAGAELVWANARDTALGFYERHGFHVDGDGFVDETTALPHHVVVRHRP